MKRNLGIFILVVALAGGAIWLFYKPEPAPAKIATAPKAEAPKPTAPKPAVSQQVVAPTTAPAKPNAVETKSEPAKPASDAQAELSTSLSDMISLVQAGDLLTAVQRYLPPEFLAKMPPEEKAAMEQEFTTGMSQPAAQQGVQMIVTVLQGMQAQAPTLNAAGDQATYQVSDPSGSSAKTEPFIFRKIDGKWYVDPEAMGAL